MPISTVWSDYPVGSSGRYLLGLNSGARLRFGGIAGVRFTFGGTHISVATIVTNWGEV